MAGAGGDQTAAAQLPNARLMRVQAFVTEVETQTAAPANVVVTLGDSITEGATSTSNAFRGWPDRLAERLAGTGWGVVNAGISGNRLLRYGAGPTALARLDRDVLSVPGVKVIVLMEGINDIGRGFAPTGAREPITLEALEAADRQIIARAHEHGVRVIGATLTPYQGASYASPEGEGVRTALNQWIKTGGAFDGVIDFAPVVALASNPLTFDPAVQHPRPPASQRRGLPGHGRRHRPEGDHRRTVSRRPDSGGSWRTCPASAERGAGWRVTQGFEPWIRFHV